jgi:hypothetical protein
MASVKEEVKNLKPSKYYLELEGENYVPWTIRTRNQLEDDDVWKYVESVAEGGVDTPANDATAAKKKEFKEGNSTALKTIIKYLQDPTVTDLQEHSKSAREMWQELEDTMTLSSENDKRNARTDIGDFKHKYHHERRHGDTICNGETPQDLWARSEPHTADRRRKDWLSSQRFSMCRRALDQDLRRS